MTTAPPKSVEVEYLTPHTGALIRIDKERLLSGETSEQLRTTLLQRGVLVFRDVHFDEDDLRTFARSIGDLRIGTAKRASDGATLVEGDEGVLKVSLDEKVNPAYAKFLIGNQLWHMDGTYSEAIPPFATMLYPVRLSKTGGDTLFANTYAAYEDLSDEDKSLIAPLRVRHTLPAALFPAKRDVSAEEFAVWASYPQHTHPLVWQHESGRRSLVLSTACAFIEEMDSTESHDLLQRLMQHATQDKYVYRHKWRMGDLAMWDNTGTMHRVLPFDQESGRLLHRATLNGEEAITAVSG